MRLNWMRGTQVGHMGVGNMGDLFAPILLAAFTGQPVRYTSSRSWHRRLITIGTIGQKQRFGQVDVWGAGFGSPEQSAFHVQTGFRHPPLTRFVPHALRGPFSAALLRRAGYVVPHVYGDPAWLLPRLWPGEAVQKRWDLGVIVHLSETDRMDPAAGASAEFERYAVPQDLHGHVRVFSTLVEQDVGQVRARVEDILACRRVLTTSLHALAVAEAYGVPCAAFDFHAGTSGRVAVDDDGVPVDHRMRDFYAGSGARDVLVYRTERHLPTDWQAAMAFIDRHWAPLRYDPSPLLEAFPARLQTLSERPDAAVMARLATLAALRD